MCLFSARAMPDLFFACSDLWGGRVRARRRAAGVLAGIHGSLPRLRCCSVTISISRRFENYSGVFSAGAEQRVISSGSSLVRTTTTTPEQPRGCQRNCCAAAELEPAFAPRCR